jgi:hypothetical protein
MCALRLRWIVIMKDVYRLVLASRPMCCICAYQVPMAPALGLLLHECCYHSYNNRWASGGEECRPRLSLADWASAVEEFKACLASMYSGSLLCFSDIVVRSF